MSGIDTRDVIIKHATNAFGMQHCRRCNVDASGDGIVPLHTACQDCGGLGWLRWAALAREPYSLIVDGLYQGGCIWDSQDGSLRAANHYVTDADPYDAVVTMYPDWQRYGPDIHDGAKFAGKHSWYTFGDEGLTPAALDLATLAAERTMRYLDSGDSVMLRCQAGLNRSGLVTGLVLKHYFGLSGRAAVDLIRAQRGPWALCNDSYAEHLSEDLQV